jgi:DNA/RNA endonuclease YhcR with UshA esterase domain
MTKLTRTFAVTAFFATLVAVSFAQARGGRNYNPATETTVKGTVEEVQQIPGQRGGTGTHLMLKTNSGTLDVHVGPTSFVSNQQFSFAKGDEVEVTGSQAGSNTLIAREIKKDGKVLTLRNQQGIPAWSGGGGRQQ